MYKDKLGEKKLLSHDFSLTIIIFQGSHIIYSNKRSKMIIEKKNCKQLIKLKQHCLLHSYRGIVTIYRMVSFGYTTRLAAKRTSRRIRVDVCQRASQIRELKKDDIRNCLSVTDNT